MARDYYDVLGVPRDASQRDIKRAYRRLAREWHPDVKRDDPEAARRFKEIQTAYDALGDETKRGRYDQFGPAFEQFEGGGPGGGGPQSFRFDGSQVDLGDLGGFGDILGNLFGGLGGARGARGGPRFHGAGPGAGHAGPGPHAGPQRGADVEVSLELSLEELVHGAVRDLVVTVEDPCGHCGGRGLERTGRVCPVCAGRGKQGRQQTVKGVKIPAGAEAGAVIKVRGKGGAAPPGGTVGDLNLRIGLREHPYFKPLGADLECELPISLAEALDGAEVQVPTLQGLRPLRLPPGTQGGQRFRVKGYGLPNRKTGVPGNLLVRVQLVLPTEVTDDERQLARQWSARAGDPRSGLWQPRS